MNWYLKVFRDYFNFEGRARRSEYWMFSLYNFSFATILFIIDAIFRLSLNFFPFGWFCILYAVTSFVPSIAVTVRRLHDVGKSGWMILLCLIPFFGGIWLFILLILNGDSQKNEYGENPKFESKDEDCSNADSIIQLVLISTLINVLIYKVAAEFINSEVFYKFYKSINYPSLLFWSIVPITLSFALKDKNKRLPFLILGSIYFLYTMKEVFDTLKELLYNWYLFS
jgi:uncharacterized membrane protein YhaH (DUF805 family)